MEEMTVGILIFDDVEVLDFCGPFEVFSVTEWPEGTQGSTSGKPFKVYTIAERAVIIKCRGGLLVQPHFTIDQHPALDILLVPGGWGTRREASNVALLNWIEAQDGLTRFTTSVCTGALLLAARGLLDGLPATTHWGSIERMRDAFPKVEVRENVRFVDNGRVITSAGISAGIDMSLHIVQRLLGDDAAANTARAMEYERRSDSPGAV